MQTTRPRGLNGSVLGHRSLPPEFESRRGHIWMVFRLWLCGRSAYLAYHVHKAGHKISVIIIIAVQTSTCRQSGDILSQVYAKFQQDKIHLLLADILVLQENYCLTLCHICDDITVLSLINSNVYAVKSTFVILNITFNLIVICSISPQLWAFDDIYDAVLFCK